MRQAVAARFPAGRAEPALQWFSDNEGMYTALEMVIAAQRLGLAPIITPAYSPESNGMAEAFVKTLKRDYVDGADLSSAAAVPCPLGKNLQRCAGIGTTRVRDSTQRDAGAILGRRGGQPQRPEPSRDAVARHGLRSEAGACRPGCARRGWAAEKGPPPRPT